MENSVQQVLKQFEQFNLAHIEAMNDPSHPRPSSSWKDTRYRIHVKLGHCIMTNRSKLNRKSSKLVHLQISNKSCTLLIAPLSITTPSPQLTTMPCMDLKRYRQGPSSNFQATQRIAVSRCIFLARGRKHLSSVTGQKGSLGVDLRQGSLLSSASRMDAGIFASA